jgi:hypothetical protein
MLLLKLVLTILNLELGATTYNGIEGGETKQRYGTIIMVINFAPLSLLMVMEPYFTAFWLYITITLFFSPIWFKHFFWW